LRVCFVLGEETCFNLCFKVLDFMWEFGSGASLPVLTDVAAGRDCSVPHGILRHPGFPNREVERFWRDLKKNYHVKELVDPADERDRGQWGGIGVVYIR
tara:strand:+ start:364 stop:660 length:297 start_codon:yes stop_codon:yes gene_type:complete